MEWKRRVDLKWNRTNAVGEPGDDNRRWGCDLGGGYWVGDGEGRVGEEGEGGGCEEEGEGDLHRGCEGERWGRGMSETGGKRVS